MLASLRITPAMHAHMRRNRNEDMTLTHDVDASNRAAIDAYNEEVESRGVFSDGLRTF